MKCYSVNKNGNRCNRNSFLFSRYCFQHQDLSVKFALILAFLGIIATIAVAIYQERNPNLIVEFDLAKSTSPSSIICKIINSGNEEALNVNIGFSERLIVGTEVRAETYLGIRFEKSKTLPNPNQDPELSKKQLAFTLTIPRIVPDDTISILLTTNDSENLRTSKHYTHLLHEIYWKILRIQSALEKIDSLSAKIIDPTLIMHKITKDHSYFTPLNVYYEKGKIPIKFISENERTAYSNFQNLLNRYSKELSDSLNIDRYYNVPVVRIETTDGISTMGKILPYIGFYTVVSNITDEMYSKAGTYNFALEIPKDYNITIPLENPVDYKNNFEVYIKKPRKGFQIKPNQTLLLDVFTIYDTKGVENKKIAKGDSTIVIGN